jgi:CheY-like chemotaxis protein
LVVDDDPAMLRSVARLLRQFGYVSLLFSSAEAFANRSDLEEAVCVLLDINLGDGSGIELRLRLKAAGSSVPVIYMTGNDSPAVRTAALQSGVLRLSHQAILGEVAEGAARRDSLGCLTLSATASPSPALARITSSPRHGASHQPARSPDHHQG